MTWDGLDEAGVRALTGAPRAWLLDAVPSVLDVAHELAADGAPSGTLVLAEEQTEGRGRSGRSWHSPRGTGIWMALLMRPKEPPLGGALGIRVGLALVGALRERQRVLPVALKWPNDVVVQGRKAGGVLCEARWLGPRLGWIAAGIGLNVRGPVDERVRDTADLETRAQDLKVSERELAARYGSDLDHASSGHPIIKSGRDDGSGSPRFTTHVSWFCTVEASRDGTRLHR